MITFLIGLVVGGVVTLFVLGICRASKDADEISGCQNLWRSLHVLGDANFYNRGSFEVLLDCMLHAGVTTRMLEPSLSVNDLLRFWTKCRDKKEQDPSTTAPIAS